MSSTYRCDPRDDHQSLQTASKSVLNTPVAFGSSCLTTLGVICMLRIPFRSATLKGPRAGRVVRHWVSRHVRADCTVRE